MKQETKICQNCKQNFTIEPEDFDFYEKIKVPPPTFCWQCRFERRCAYRNERRLMRATSSKSGKPIFTLYPPDAGLTLYDADEWYADDWDQMATGREYDFSRPFFVQLSELAHKAPLFARNVINNVNCDYCAYTGYSKNCYLIFQTVDCEDSAYGNAVDYSRSCFDNSHLAKCERCYNSFWLTNCHRVHCSMQCTDCVDLWFSKNCRNCSDCFGCVNLTNQKYCIFNQPYSKEEYKNKIMEMNLDKYSSFQVMAAAAEEFWLKFPNRYLQGMMNDDVTGEYIYNSKNIHYGYLVRGSRDLKYVQYMQLPGNVDCYDATMWGENSELFYETVGSGDGHRIRFCMECHTKIRDLEYCINCVSCSNCFGCVGLRKKEYCIFNKQYTPEEFRKLRERIVQHMNDMPYADKMGRTYRYGEFFPLELSYYGYDTDLMRDHFFPKKEHALEQGYAWYEPDRREYETTFDAKNLPDSIKEVTDEILKEVIRCNSCAKAFRIIPIELAFLRREGIPAPRLCYECRHKRRIVWRNKTPLYSRKCHCNGMKSENGVYQNTVSHQHGTGKCPNEFETSYAPDRKEIVYCEQCYQSEVV